MDRPIVRRGSSAKQIALTDPLRAILRSPSRPEEMVRSVASLLALDIGQYCIVDVVDRGGALKRLVAAHTDPGRIGRVLAACDRTDPGPRVTALFLTGRAEICAEVERDFAMTHLDDIDFLERERVRSYMAQPVTVNGAPFALFTMVITSGPRRYGREDAALLEVVSDWTGLGLENALRREAQPRLSTFPPLDETPADEPRNVSR